MIGMRYVSDTMGILRGTLFLENEPLSLDTLAKRTGYSNTTVFSSMSHLENLGVARYMTITTSAQRGYGILNSAFYVSIFRGACSSCREDTQEEYAEHLDDRRIGYVLMQDKDRDKFKFYNNMTRTEKLC
jgi:DNA-binding transcriptional regulator GbsR (MarR family)